ncbi:MAG TPA: four helix bundle protein [Verrucomicrobiae bacterium]|nr:four helix bundle protein [Verrucomicrobiae bacterium]
MATIQRFEDIEAWKKGRELRKAIYALSRNGKFGADFGLKDQIRRAAVSITSNIAEGFERGGNREFIQFLANSKGSCGEVRDQPYVALDEQYISKEQFDSLYDATLEISRMLSGFMQYLQQSEIRGSKFKKPVRSDKHETLNMKL